MIEIIRKAVIALALAAICTTTPKAETKPLSESWKCDHILLTATCQPGHGFPSSKNPCSGTVKIGQYPSQEAGFHIQGTALRWDWGTGEDDAHSIVIKPSEFLLKGAYYNFSNVPVGKKISPTH